MQQNGWIKLPERAANEVAWAHHIPKKDCQWNSMGRLYFKHELPMRQNGPVKLAESAADGIEWAH